MITTNEVSQFSKHTNQYMYDLDGFFCTFTTRYVRRMCRMSIRIRITSRQGDPENKNCHPSAQILSCIPKQPTLLHSHEPPPLQDVTAPRLHSPIFLRTQEALHQAQALIASTFQSREAKFSQVWTQSTRTEAMSRKLYWKKASTSPSLIKDGLAENNKKLRRPSSQRRKMEPIHKNRIDTTMEEEGESPVFLNRCSLPQGS